MAINETASVGQLISKEVVIPSGGSGSPDMDLGGLTLVGIIFHDFTATALTITTSEAIDGTYVTLADKTGAPLEYTVAPEQYLVIDPAETMGLNFVNLQFDAPAADDQTITLMLKGL